MLKERNIWFLKCFYSIYEAKKCLNVLNARIKMLKIKEKLEFLKIIRN